MGGEEYRRERGEERNERERKKKKKRVNLFGESKKKGKKKGEGKRKRKRKLERIIRFPENLVPAVALYVLVTDAKAGQGGKDDGSRNV